MGPTRVCSFTARLQRAAPVIRTTPADLRVHTGIGNWEMGIGPRSPAHGRALSSSAPVVPRLY